MLMKNQITPKTFMEFLVLHIYIFLFLSSHLYRNAIAVSGHHIYIRVCTSTVCVHNRGFRSPTTMIKYTQTRIKPSIVKDT